jgi:hypothetical protein
VPNRGSSDQCSHQLGGYRIFETLLSGDECRNRPFADSQQGRCLPGVVIRSCSIGKRCNGFVTVGNKIITRNLR